MVRPATAWQLDPTAKTALRHAMLSVYYRSLGAELELRGAPSVLLPPEVRPLTLAEALAILEPYPQRQRDALWRVMLAVPVGRGGGDDVQTRYPPAMVDLLGLDFVTALHEERRRYRADAHLFAGALVSCAEGRWDEFDDLRALLGRRWSAQQGSDCFSSATAIILGQNAPDFLGTMSSRTDRDRVRNQLVKLEDEVGLRIQDFVADLSDAAAFLALFDGAPVGTADVGAATVFPVSSVIRQSSATLTTTATVTTLVSADFQTLANAVDPRNWQRSSDVITLGRYVSSAFDLVPVPQEEAPVIGEGFDRPHLLEEKATLSWGRDAEQEGSFHNVLNIDTYAVRDRLIDLKFSLCRSIGSRILWDDRAGGILVNEGYLKVRPLVPGYWRVTSRKVLRFSDRTPYVNPQGWLDFGQMLNYFAPAALTFWLESETYSIESEEYRSTALTTG